MFGLMLLWTQESPAIESWDTISSQVYGSFSTCTQDADADIFSTTVDADSNSGQAVLKLTATTDLVAGDVVVADADNSNSKREACIVASVSAGDSVTCTTNLTFSHTAAQGDDVVLTNRLPATGTTGFTALSRYLVYCHDGTGLGVACECVQGTVTASAANAVGFTLFAGEKAIVKIPKALTFFSCVGFTDSIKVDICLLN